MTERPAERPIHATRSPLEVGLLAALTGGVYGIAWYYSANRQLRDLGRLRNESGLEVNPFLAALAIGAGLAVWPIRILLDLTTPTSYLLSAVAAVPFVISWFRTARRFRIAQEQPLATSQPYRLVVLALFLVLPLPPLPTGLDAIALLVGFTLTILLYACAQAALDQIQRVELEQRSTAARR